MFKKLFVLGLVLSAVNSQAAFENVRPVDLSLGNNASYWKYVKIDEAGQQVGEFRVNVKKGELDLLKVEKRFQGQGHGKELFREAAQFLGFKGHKTMGLKAKPIYNSSLEQLIEFYTKMGARLESNNGQEADMVYSIR